MSRQVSVLYTLKDNFTNSLLKIGSEQSKFKKSLQRTSLELSGLYDKKRKLQIDNRVANKAIRDTAKNADKLGSDLKNVMRQKVDKRVKIQFDLMDVNRQIKDTNKKLNDTGKKKIRPEVSVKDNASKTLNNISSKMKGLSKGVIIGAAGVAAGATAAVGAGIGYSLKLAGEEEQSRIAFETMLKSKQKSDKLLSQMKEFAIATPFEYDGLRDSAKKMLAYGFNDNDIIPMMTAVGNAASGLGLGSDGVDRITIALGQMRAKAKVSGDEMRQLTEAGIPAWEMLSEATGKSTAQLMKLSEKGAIPANDAIKALLKGMNKRFPNMMEKQSKTLFGLWSSIKDFAKLNIFSAFGEGIRSGILPTLTKFTEGLTKNKDGLEGIKKKLTGLGESIGKFVGENSKKLYDFFSKLFNDPTFQKADLGGKVNIVLNGMYTNIKAWFDSEGGPKLHEVFKENTQKAMNTIITVAKDNVKPAAALGLEIGGAIIDGMLEGIGNSILPVDNLLKSITDKHSIKTGDDFYLNNPKELEWLKRQLKTYTPEKRKTLSDQMPKAYQKGVDEGWWPAKAFGMPRVPKDNYPVRLHEGEKVLTKQEAGRQSGKVLIIQKLAEQLIIREEADIDKIVDKLAVKFVQASNNTGGAYGVLANI